MSEFQANEFNLINCSQPTDRDWAVVRMLVSLVSLASFLFAEKALADQPMLAPSPTTACMTLTDKNARVEYPEFAFARKEGGVVPVELIFHAPNEAPEVKVTDDTAYYEMIRAVERYVVRFRMPCMKAEDPPVTIRQSYVFQPNE